MSDTEPAPPPPRSTADWDSVRLSRQLDALYAAFREGAFGDWRDLAVKEEWRTRSAPIIDQLHAAAAAELIAGRDPLDVSPLTVNTPPVVAGEFIESAWGNTVRADLLALDSTKLTQAQVDARVTAVGDPRFVNVAGDTMTSFLTWGGDPAVSSPAMQIYGAGIFNSNNGAAPNLRLKQIAPATAYLAAFYWGSVLIGSITRNGTDSGVIFNTTSDGRYKHVDADVDPADAAEVIRALHPVIYRWREIDPETGWDPDGAPTGPQQVGLIAQEVQPLIPSAVNESVEDPSQPWGLDYGRITPHLAAALQAALDRIDSLTARIEALEGGAT